ncbi:hypothetical protein PCY10_04150 [Streptococcus sp. SI1]|uniref:hypothetical protein n=1 Tax=Streptococcus sp. SI1 TaxID=3018245 RepID=UPI00263C2BC5|nr:hypothetical protein [Streptococcus sp. SI1]MDN5016746.1 hypothetical protein [Streptococcus sp. SI1]
MALNDENVQELQVEVLNIIKDQKTGKKFVLDGTGKEYQLIHKVNETTQAIAVAPIVNGKPDYSQTTIVAAGTQDMNHDVNKHVAESLTNAVGATTGLTEQTKDIRRFYKEAKEKIPSANGVISNMSGFSQSGPAVAKVAAENKVERVTNFMDWGAAAAVKQGLSSSKGLTPKEVAYLKQHAHIYSDAGKDVTNFDGGGGAIPYGRVFTVDGKKHSAAFPRMKENGLDTDWYVKQGKFCSGMTEKQVRAIAKKKASQAKEFDIRNPETWFDSTDPEFYVKEYKRIYGSFAKENKRLTKLKYNRQKISSLHKQLSSASGSKRVSLREELVGITAQTAQLQSEEFERAIQEKLAEYKEKVEEQIKEVRKASHEMAQYLSAIEVEAVLADFTISACWDEAIEVETLKATSTYKTQLDTFSSKLNEVAEHIIETDRNGATLFARNY